MSTGYLEFRDRYTHFQSRKGGVEFRAKAHLPESIPNMVEDDMADPSAAQSGEGEVCWYIGLQSPETRSVVPRMDSKSGSPSECLKPIIGG